jgi:hypothetical protein
MNNPTMLYRCPGPETFEGVACETTVVDEPDVDAMLADGWSRDWIAADAVHKEAAAKLAANEEEQARIAAELAAADPDADVIDPPPGASGLGEEVQTGLTKEQALAAVA